MASIMDILKIKPFVEVSVGQLLWGYDDPLLKLAKDVVPKEQMLPYDQFGLLYGKNGTTADAYTIFAGQSDVTKYGMLDKWNGKSGLGHWTTPSCDSVYGGDGSIFPPHITKETVLRVFDKDLCRALPLIFKVGTRLYALLPITPYLHCFPSSGGGDHCRWSSRIQICATQGRFRYPRSSRGSAVLLSRGTALRTAGNLQCLKVSIRLAHFAQLSPLLAR